MPAKLADQTVYISTTGPETFFNQAALYKPGELGKKFVDVNGKTYQIVQVDSAAAGGNATIANGLLYWSDRANYKVVPRFTDALNTAGQNGIAGRCPGITAVGRYLAMQVGGPGVFVSSGAIAAGASVVSNSAGTASDVITMVTTASGIIAIGPALAAAAGNLVTVDIMLDSGGVR